MEGGPGLATCAELIRRCSTQPAVDLRHFVGWIFFNLYAGNNDSHAKNLSIYRLPVPDAFERATREVKPALPHSARMLADRLRQFVLSTTKRLTARLAG